MTHRLATVEKIRDLDGIEKVFWLLDQNRSTHFCLTAEVEGSTTPEAWSDALEEIGRLSPFVGTQVVQDLEGRPYFTKSIPRGVPIIVVNGGLDQWPSQVASELAAPFEVAKDPLIRARLLHSVDRCVLILTFHHAISDGSSSVYFLRNVLRAIGGEARSPSGDTTSLEQAVEDRGWPLVDAPPAESRGVAAPGFRLSDARRASVIARSLSQAATGALRVRARAESTTVHGALCAAAASTFSALHPGHAVNPPRVFTPIDARRRLLDETDHLGVFVNGANIRLEEAAASLWEDARTFSLKLKPFNNPDLLASGVRSVRSLMNIVSSVQGAADVWAEAFGAEVMLTNLAAIDLPTTYGRLKLADVWVPAVSTGIESEQTIGVITVGGRMHLLHTTYEPADQFLDMMVGSLIAATS